MVYAGLCRSKVVSLGPNVAWLSAGGGKVRRKDSRGEPWQFASLHNWWVSHTLGLPSHSLMPPLTLHPCEKPSRMPTNGLHPLLQGRGLAAAAGDECDCCET